MTEVTRMKNDTIYVEKDPPIARVVFDRPDQNNPMNDEWRADFVDALASVKDDDEVSAVIIKGNGRSLTSGGDLSAISDVFGGTAHDDRQNSLRIGRFLYQTVWQFPKPVVLQVHGYCIGGGISLMAVSDLVVIEDEARIGSPEARALGFEPLLGFWALTIGPRWTKLMLLTGDSIDGRTAEEIGMVTKSVPKDELEAYVEWLTGRVAKVGVEALSIYKEAINTMFEILGMEALVKAGMVYNHLAHGTSQAQEFFQRIQSDGIRDAVAWRDDPFGGPQKQGGHLPIVDGPDLNADS